MPPLVFADSVRENFDTGCGVESLRSQRLFVKVLIGMVIDELPL